jgi:photosystem II stability/assembly factor-like uncharacterized protein
MSTSGGATWKDLDKTMEDGTRIAFGSIYQAGCSIDQKTSVRKMAVFKSTDEGKTWKRTLFEKEDGILRALVVHPRNGKILFAGGQLGPYSSTPKSMLYKSTDAGASWNEVGDLCRKPGGIEGMCFDPANPKRLVVVMKKSIYISEDEGASWTPRDIGGTCIVADPAKKGRFFLGSENGVWVSNDGGKSWKEMNDGLSSRSIACIDLDSKNSILYAGTSRAGVVRLRMSGARLTTK